MLKISAFIITLNEENTIRECVKSVSWCDEILVIDSGSTDRTASICESEGCKVIYNKFKSFSSQRQFASDQAANDWVLYLDADERLTPELIEELQGLNDKNINDFEAYRIKFKTYIYGHLMHSCGLSKEKHIRLYNRKKVHFPNMLVHENLKPTGPVGMMANCIIHHTYADLFDHFEKINRYTELWSTDRFSKGEKTTIFKIIVQIPIKFLHYYIFRGGFRDGFAGFIFSYLYGVYSIMKYAKLYQKQKK
jgi:glycosyltransferase involved in cell wall biosynthesis